MPIDIVSDNIKYNQEQAKKVLSNQRIKLLSDADFMLLTKFICVVSSQLPEMPQFVSPATVRFYDYDVTRLMCYSCQNESVELPITQIDQEAEMIK